MKLLLTSPRIRNPSIYAAMLELLRKPGEDCVALAIPTAAYGHAPEGFARVQPSLSGLSTNTPMIGLGWKSIGVLELTALPRLPRESWVPVAEAAAVLLATAGGARY